MCRGWCELQYFIHSFNKKVEISSAEFSKLTKARSELSLQRSIEVLFDLLAHSYLEFERLLLNNAFDYASYKDNGYFTSDKIDESETKINVFMLSLLQTATSYIEQTKSQLKKIDANFKVQFETQLNKTYDENIEFRVMQQLRNIAIHGNSELVQLSFGNRREYEKEGDMESPARTRIVNDPRVSITTILSNKKTKRLLREELEEISKDFSHIDLKYFTRQYIRLLFLAHQEIRRITEPSFDLATQSILDLVDFLASNDFDRNGHFFLAQETDTDRFKRSVDTHFVNHIKQKRENWVNLDGTLVRYVSNEIHLNHRVFIPKETEIFIPR
jgi:hypothetical protein